MPCVFCTEPHNAGEPIFDDGRMLALLHPDWAVRGHAMLVWTEHVENLSDLTPDEYAVFFKAHQRVERALLDVTGADRAVLLKLGIVTPHLHLHIYPVSASLDRAQVMEIIDGKTVDPMSDEERRAFIEELRHRLA
jgi:diadenosine tetraphosphate (Ap4A) HIT family hydrolase